MFSFLNPPHPSSAAIYQSIDPLCKDNSCVTYIHEQLGLFPQEARHLTLNVLLFTLCMPACWAAERSKIRGKQIDMTSLFAAAKASLREACKLTASCRAGDHIVDGEDFERLFPLFLNDGYIPPNDIRDTVLEFYDLCLSLYAICMRDYSSLLSTILSDNPHDLTKRHSDVLFHFTMYTLRKSGIDLDRFPEVSNPMGSRAIAAVFAQRSIEIRLNQVYQTMNALFRVR